VRARWLPSLTARVTPSPFLSADPFVEPQVSGPAQDPVPAAPAMEHEATLAAVRKVRPAPWEVTKPAPQHEVVLTGMVDE
jgi:hypothetical protein